MTLSLLVLGLFLPTACSDGGGSRFNGDSGSSVFVPPAPTTPPTVQSLTVLGGVNTVTGLVDDPLPPFQGAVAFNYLLNDAEDENLSLLIEFARQATPTNFQPCTLINASNPLTNLQAVNYEDASSSLNQFIWDAATDLSINQGGLFETVQFRVTAMDPSQSSAPFNLTGGIVFNFPAPPNQAPSVNSVTVDTSAGTMLSGRVTINYDVTDPDNDNLNLTWTFVGPPATPGGPPPAPQPMTLIQVNGSPDPAVDGQAANAGSPNLFNVGTANYTGTVVWDTLADIGVSSFQDYTIVLQVSDGTASAPSTQVPGVNIGNPTAAFAPNVTVVGRQGNISLSLEVFDSDSDLVKATFEVTFNGTDFVPMTLTNASAGSITANAIDSVPSSPDGTALNVTWQSTSDVPTDVMSGMIRVTIEDDDPAGAIPNRLPNEPENPSAPPLPNLFQHGPNTAFTQGSLFFLSPSFPLAGAPLVVSIREASEAGLRTRYFGAVLNQTTTRFEIEGENFGTDESLVTVNINNISQVVVEADSNFLVVNLTNSVSTGLCQVIVNGVGSNQLPVLIRGENYWEDATAVDNVDSTSLPASIDPSVTGQMRDMDGDGDLDIFIAQDGQNSLLINRNENTSIRTTLGGPYNISGNTNQFVVYVMKSAINRNKGPYNLNSSDNLTVTTIKSNNNAANPQSIVTTTTINATDRATAPAFEQTSPGYVAATLNSNGSTNLPGRDRDFDASILNLTHLEILPRHPADTLAVFEGSTGAFPNRKPIGFNQGYRQAYGSTGTDLVRVTSGGPFVVGESVTRAGINARIVRVNDLGNGSFDLDITRQPQYNIGDTLLTDGGTSATISNITRVVGTPLGGVALTLNLPVGSLPTADLVTLLNNAAIAAGLDVPGQTVTLRVGTNTGFVNGATLTTPTGATGVVIGLFGTTIVKLQSTSSFNLNDPLQLGGNTFTTVQEIIPTRNDFVARLSQSGVTVELVSNDYIVVGNGSANQPLGFVSQRLFTMQKPFGDPDTGSFTFPAGFEDLTITIGNGTNSDAAVTVPLSGTMTVDEVIDAINQRGIQGRLAGDPNAGNFEAAKVNGSIELRTDDPTKSVHIADMGAQRILGFVGRFIKPAARGLGRYADQSGSRLLNQSSDFSTRVELADVNEDGAPDIVVANAQAQNTLRLNNGQGVFSDLSTTLLPALQDESFGIRLGDLDNDGDFDMVVANRGRNRVLENRTGDINPNTNNPFTPGLFTDRSFTSFSNVVEASTLKLSTDVDICDVDRDGFNDIAFANLQRQAGSGPSLFFNTNITLANSTAANPKFVVVSAALNNPATAVDDVATDLIRQATVPLFTLPRVTESVNGLTSTNVPKISLENFGVAFGDFNADGVVDLAVVSEATGFIPVQNKVYIQDSTTIVIEQAPTDQAAIQKVNNLFVENGPLADTTIVREVFENFPSANQITLVLDPVATANRLPNGFNVGTRVVTTQRPVLRTLITTVGPDATTGKVFLCVPDNGNPPNGNQDPNNGPNNFRAGFFVRGQTSGQVRQIIDIINDPGNPAEFDLCEVNNINGFIIGEILEEVPGAGTIVATNVSIFGERTQQAPFTNTVIESFNPQFQSLFAYPANLADNNGAISVDQRASDSSKDIAIANFGSLSSERTPNSPASQVSGLNANTSTANPGGGGTTFTQVVAIANSEDRTNNGGDGFERGNVLFVINNAFGFKNVSFDDNFSAFVSSPFVINDPVGGASKSHAPLDDVESFGTELGDVDNDGDVDVLYLNGGGQGQAAQNFIYIAKFTPGDPANLNDPYP